MVQQGHFSIFCCFNGRNHGLDTGWTESMDPIARRAKKQDAECEVLTSGGLHYYKHAHTHRHADTGLQKAYRLNAGTLAPVLFQLGSYQCVWWVVIRRYNASGSWPANHNGGCITATATLPSHSQQPMCP